MDWVFIGAGVVDPSQQARNNVIEKFGVHGDSEIAAVLSQVATDGAGSASTLGIVIAVKPHIVKTACVAATEALANRATQLSASSKNSSQVLFISVAAGVRAGSLQCWLPAGAALVRCMPNTPALLGLGATALFANSACSDQHKRQANQLMQAAGSSVWVEQEQQLDAVTALSGSGPAYFFFLIEHMIETGVSLGLPEQTASQLAIDTAYGAASMARRAEQSPAVLRNNVTSKGGTTAAAIEVFNNKQTADIIKAAMQAAYQRAVELGDDLDPDT